MKRDKFQTGKTNAYLNSLRPYADVTIEMVTEDMMMVCLTMPVDARRVDGAAWQLAHTVDAVAYQIERETGNPFRSFVLTFSAAWDFICSRKTIRRKESAAGLALPPFLAGSVDPSRE